ncbi:wax ester/triacylglycerol synthase domain-containing protein [Nocardia africana]|uniref:diacylglycerol O-acyltransferase n=1 Tax=Nocardia africana TaxID=134964 RepID=A0ABW6NQK5_9NOCA
MTDTRESHLSQSDLFSWSMERDAILRSTIVSVVMLDAEPDWERLVRAIDRGTRVAPRFRDRLVALPAGLAPPRWEADPDFDLSWHMRRVALPAAVGRTAVFEFARVEAMTAFDPVRPLWQVTVLGDVTGGGSALVLKVHHCLTDGLGGIQLANEIVDFTRSGGEPRPDPEPAPATRGGLADILGWNWAVGSELLRGGLAHVLPLARHALTHPMGTVRDGMELAVSIGKLARPVVDTLSPVMTKRGLARHLSTLDVPLEPLRRAAHTVGCTLNDAFLAGVVIGLHRYHELHETEVERLRVTMPVSVRKDTDPIGGNRITLVRFALPAGITDPAALMPVLDAMVAGWRHEPAIPYSAAVAATLNRLPVAMVTAMLKHVDFVASDVPGSPVPIYIAGAAVERMYAFGPTIGTAFNVTLISHADTCCVGINADTAAVPDVEVFTDCLAEGFHAVLELGETR